MLLVLKLSYSQDKLGNVLVYRHGCHGKCKLHDFDTCGLKKDTVFEMITIRKIENQFLKNKNTFNLSHADSLNALIDLYWNRIDTLDKTLKISKKAFFVPSYPDCSEFEEFIIYRNKKILRYEIFDLEHNETFEVLTKSDLKIFNRIKELIK
jgi:hypothetical protein